MATEGGASSSQVAEDSSSGEAGPHDLLIIGPGVLGRLVAVKWKTDYPDCRIVGQTFTTDDDAELIALGINPSPKQTILSQKFPYVIFCDRPPKFPHPNYFGNAARNAGRNWRGDGSFLLTSSCIVYERNDNGPCVEDDPAVPPERRSEVDVFLKAEKVTLMLDGCVLRLADLYDADRGVHIDWLGEGTVDLRPDHILNLLHYEDAASLAVAILKKKIIGRIFLGCDNHPLTRQEIMDLVNKSGKYDKKFHRFTGTSDPLGNKLNNSRTRNVVGWEPKYPSFAQFLGVS